MKRKCLSYCFIKVIVVNPSVLGIINFIVASESLSVAELNVIVNELSLSRTTMKDNSVESISAFGITKFRFSVISSLTTVTSITPSPEGLYFYYY